MLDDVRFGWRKLRQEPSFTAIAVLTLALGIGATSAVFSLIQGVLLTPPPYRDPEQLVLVQRARTDGQAGPPQRWSAAQWLEWQRDSKVVRGDGRVRLVVQLPRLGRGQRVARGHVRQQRLLQRPRIAAAARAHVQRIRDDVSRGSGHHPRLRPLAAEIRRRSEHRRQADSHQPP